MQRSAENIGTFHFPSTFFKATPVQISIYVMEGGIGG